VLESAMIDHLTIVVSDYERSKAFYLAALAPLGYCTVMELSREQIPALSVAKTIGLGVGGKPDLWLRPSTDPITPTHIALRASDRATVDAFHRAALAANARDNGEPGLRPHYHPSYYGAFVLDPDGYNLEVVCHERVTDER
jgi:catechol 2,3-dioxygenase-like lactoylglutathione lyase family enzyme